jgi:hypothetical protein
MNFLLNISAGVLLSSAVFLSPLHAMDSSFVEQGADAKFRIGVVARDCGAKLIDKLNREGALVPGVIENRYACSFTKYKADKARYIELLSNKRELSSEEENFKRSVVDSLYARRHERMIEIGYDKPKSYSGQSLLEQLSSQLSNVEYMPFEISFAQPDDSREKEWDPRLASEYNRISLGIAKAIEHKVDVLIIVEPSSLSFSSLCKKMSNEDMSVFLTEEPRFEPYDLSLTQKFVNNIIYDNKVQQKLKAKQ